eukprot:17172_1
MSTQTVKVNRIYATDHVGVECMYVIDRFLFSTTVVYNFNRQTIQMKAITIKHANFNVNLHIFEVNKKINESIYHGVLSIVDENINIDGSLQRYLDSETPLTELTEDIAFLKRRRRKAILRREIIFKASVSAKPDKVTNAYLLTIQFVKAPSLLHDKTFEISIDYHQILKQHFAGTVARRYDVYIANALVSLIFDGFLTKYFWMYPPSSNTSFFGTLRLDSYVVEKIPKGTSYSNLDRGLEGSKASNRMYLSAHTSNMIMNMNRKCMNRKCAHVEYVPTHDPNHAIPCTINGIGISIDINDQCINEKMYPSLFKMFKYYDIKPPELSTIWPLENPSQLYDLKHLYEGIQKYCDRNDAIQVNAQLLIDKNVEDKDIVLLLVHWRTRYSIFDHYTTLSTQYSLKLKPFVKLIDFGPHFSVYSGNNKYYPHKLRHQQAQKASYVCYENFDDAVKLYKILMRSASTKQIHDIIYRDKHHFGEPLIAVIALPKMSKFRYKGDANYTMSTAAKRFQRNQITLTKINKRKQRSIRKNIVHSAKHQKRMSKNRLYKTNKHRYHRW